MGYTNSPQVTHGDVTFVLQDEIPEVTIPFIDDVNVKGPKTRYELPDGSYECMPDNPGVRRFIYEHLVDANRVIHRIGMAGGTFSAPKAFFAVPEVEAVGHRCTYEGRIAGESCVQKIRDWPPCQTVSEVRAFLGTCGVLRVFIRDFARHARPLVDLTRKRAEFVWGERQVAAFAKMKELVMTSPVLVPIDYKSGRKVILAVDSSHIAVGYILFQENEKGKQLPSRFGSISWNDVESRYSQPKLELYGLFRALRDTRVFIIGLLKLTVEVDAKFIKGMLNNLDIQPNAAINRWIAGILLFDFTLVHVPAERHTGADGLSRRPRAPEDPEEQGDVEEWIDEAYGFAIELINIQIFILSEKSSPLMRPSSRIEPEVLILSASASDSSPPIPRSPSAVAWDAKLGRIEAFLRNPARPEGFSDTEFKRFVRTCSDFFINDDRLWRKDKWGRHKLVVAELKRFELIRQAHDDLGHKGRFSVRTCLLERFWWPHMDFDIKWFVCSCHECQVHQFRNIHIPPVVVEPAPLFHKAYIDTMLMDKAQGYRYIVHARCSLTSYPEWRALRTETGRTVGAFIFEELLCRWGAVAEIVTDNGTPFISALNYLATRYGIRHIRISPYNFRADGPVERRHLDVRQALIKTAADTGKDWVAVAPSVFWSERVTIQKSTGHSPYYMVHGIEPLFPFDLLEATFLAPPISSSLSTTDLISIRARQLQKRPADLEQIHARVWDARYKSARQFEEVFKNTIHDFDFKPGTLVLVHNSRLDNDLGRKMKPRYFGLMIVVRRNRGGAYVLAEVDGALSHL